MFFLFFFFNDTATTEIYTLSLHDALPISGRKMPEMSLRTCKQFMNTRRARYFVPVFSSAPGRSEEHTSELQSQSNLVCRLLLEKKKKDINKTHTIHNIDNPRLSLMRFSLA